MNEVEILDSINMSPFNTENIHKFVHTVLDKLHVNNWLLGIVFTNDEEIRDYNLQWRKVDAVTDVLSFSQREGEDVPIVNGMPYEAGDVVICLQRVKEQALRLYRKPEEELRRVIIHGILHLNGMDHPGDNYEGEMLTIQEKLVFETQNLMVSD